MGRRGPPPVPHSLKPFHLDNQRPFPFSVASVLLHILILPRPLEIDFQDSGLGVEGYELRRDGDVVGDVDCGFGRRGGGRVDVYSWRRGLGVWLVDRGTKGGKWTSAGPKEKRRFNRE